MNETIVTMYASETQSPRLIRPAPS
jgi:hypothetical protein